MQNRASPTREPTTRAHDESPRREPTTRAHDERRLGHAIKVGDVDDTIRWIDCGAKKSPNWPSGARPPRTKEEPEIARADLAILINIGRART